jgi:hypothetical protein
MAIVKQQPGTAKAAAAAGAAIGKAQQAEEDRARAERESARRQAQAAQENARQAAMDFELQKMRMRSEQDFAQELRDRQYEFDKINVANEWDIEKMRRRSEIDFEMEEKERVRKVTELDNQIAAWNKVKDNGQFTGQEFEWQDKMTRLTAERDAAKAGVPYRQPPDMRAREMAEGRYATSLAAETRAQERHKEYMSQLSQTPEEIRRKRVIDVMGSAYREFPLDEAENEMRELGLLSDESDFSATPPDNTPYPTPNTQEQYDAIPVGATYIDSAGNLRTKS